MLRQERLDSLQDALLLVLQGFQKKIWTALPGVVASFNSDEMTVSVVPALLEEVMNSSYVKEWTKFPQLIHVPVVFPNAGGTSLTFPIKAGDEVLVVFASRCIDSWWQSGMPDLTNPPQPVEFRIHDIHDGFAIPGPRSQTRKLSGYSPSAVQLRSDDGQAYVEINPSTHNIKAHTSTNATVEAANLTATVTSALSATCATASVTASGQATVQAPTINLTGNVIISGSLTVAGAAALNGGMTVAAGGSNTATIAAPIVATGGAAVTGTLTNNGVNVGSTHVHGGVQGGSGNSAVPH